MEMITTHSTHNIAADDIIRISEQAETKMQAVIKIKQTAIMVTNASDWVDQGGKPYLKASGAEKIGLLFNISWSFLSPEPVKTIDNDGHYTYTYSGCFQMGTRSIQTEGSRSSKDPFFSQYEYAQGGKRTKDINDRDNERDVKMSAMSNLILNGIMRILGIRNISYQDLKTYADISPDKVDRITYKKNEQSPPKSLPGVPPDKKDDVPVDPPENNALVKKDETAITRVEDVVTRTGKSSKGNDWTLNLVKCSNGETYSTFDNALAIIAADLAKAGDMVEIIYETSQRGKSLKAMVKYDQDNTTEAGNEPQPF